MTTSTSRPVGSVIRFFASPATSSRVTVSVASTSSPLVFRARRVAPSWAVRNASPNMLAKMSSAADARCWPRRPGPAPKPNMLS
jgi:hypothetical protein